MKKKKDFSIRDIAQEAGCSTATVSRILNRQGGYSKELQEKVLAIVEQRQYTTGVPVSRTIGILVPDLRNEFIAEEVVALEDFLYQKGYRAMICSTNEDSSREQFCLQCMVEAKVAAVISVIVNKALIEFARKAAFPVVFVDRTPGDKSGFVAVESDNYLGGYMATELLIKKGCKRILFLGWKNSMKVNLERQQGYLDALRDYGLPILPELQAELSDTRGYYESAKDTVYYLLKRKLQFDGIFATNDMRANGALTALQMEGIQVPEQVKLVGFDDTSICKHCHPSLSSIRQDFQTLASRTVECLLEQLENPSVPLERYIVVPVSVVERGTT